ncbi:MAG: TonB C-terminal domain-containing protein [Deltaproteobacteria bacterium]|nr:TonB C-terminal domain-containing protein [Deltaproteobacteria bacterium]
MTRPDDDRSTGLGPRHWIWVIAFALSVLVNHTVVSLLPLPDLTKRPARRAVQLDVYEPLAPAAPRPAADLPLVESSGSKPLAIAWVDAREPPTPGETPLQREERRRREEERVRPPEVPPRVPLPPQPQPQPPEAPEREAEEDATQPLQPVINMHFVHLPPRTDEPETVPDDVRFFAQRTQDVEEQTRAAVTTLEDEEEAATAQARARDDQPQAPVDGESDAQPRTDEREGRDQTDREAVAAAEPRPVPVASQGGAREGRPGEAQPPEPTPPPQPQARPGGEQGTGAETPRVATAGVDATPQPEGSVAAEQQSAENPGRPGEGPDVPGGPRVEPVAPQAVAAAGAGGASGQGGSGGQAGADTAPPNQSPDLDWATAEAVFHEQLDRERQAFLEQRQERRRMGGAMDRMDRATAQLENFTPDIRPGNQTALDTLYHPFADYLTAFHRRLHPYWGDGFLVSLTAEPDTHPLNDMNLWTKLEIIVNGDGTIWKITIVRSSGNTVYDVAAIDAVFQGEPYPEPPAELQSGDGRLYLRWSFYRNHSQCGVWNAEPFILPDPPSLHEEGEPPDSEHPVEPAVK